MAKAFTVLSWNIEHLRDKQPERIKAVVKTLTQENPDVLALYEVEGKYVYEELATKLPNYTFHITEGRQVQEILVGVKNKFSAFFSQRIEFKSGNTSLRPGAFLTLRIDGANYSLMFLHLKSLTKPIGWGIRDDQFERLGKLKKKLDQKAGEGQRANFIALGDFNTMGMNYRGSAYDIPASIELDKLDKDLRRNSIRMRRLTKTAPNTFSNGSKSRYKPADLDHVVASDHLTFKTWANKAPITEKAHQPSSTPSEVDVRGWVDESSVAKQDRWVAKYSDHAYLVFQVNKV